MKHYGKFLRFFMYILFLVSVCLFCVCLIYADRSDDSDSIFSDSPYKDVKRVALTFDDGPNISTTPRLLDGLRERGVKATFFVIGKSADNNRDIIKKMYDDGHLIGNHTNTHCNLAGMSYTDAINEITLVNSVIKDITGMDTEYIRPPFGECGKQLDRELNMFKVMWDIDPRDWSVLNTKRVVNYVVSHVEDGDIILLHDIFDTSVDSALQIVDILKAEGYEFVTVDELFFP